MSVSSKSSNSSFDFDKFSLKSDDNSDDNENIFEESRVNKNCNIFNTFDVVDKKHIMVDNLLDILDKYHGTIDLTNIIDVKYLTNNLQLEIPKYIIDSRPQIPCDNCKNKITQKIGYSFIKIANKHNFLCYLCKNKFIAEINSLIFYQFEIMEETNEYSICTKDTVLYQNYKKKIKKQKCSLINFCHFLETLMSKDEINCLVSKIRDKSFDNIKYIKPYSNIRIYDFDMVNYGFARESIIKSLLKKSFIKKIDNINYKFIKGFGAFFKYKVEATNKCINCNNDLNLNKFRLEITKYNKQFIKKIDKNENIGYLHAVCNNCITYCDNIQAKCMKHFVELFKLKNFNKVITQEINNNNICNFIKNYNNTFLELLKK